MRARVDTIEPCVELILEVELVAEHAAGLEVGLDEALQPLDGALGLRIRRLAEAPVDLQLAAEAGEPRRSCFARASSAARFRCALHTEGSYV